MYQHRHTTNTSFESVPRYAKTIRFRRKRELIDLPLSAVTNLEKLLSSVRGTEGWAKIGQGAVKIVKRPHPV